MFNNAYNAPGIHSFQQILVRNRKKKPSTIISNYIKYFNPIFNNQAKALSLSFLTKTHIHIQSSEVFAKPLSQEKNTVKNILSKDTNFGSKNFTLKHTKPTLQQKFIIWKLPSK